MYVHTHATTSTASTMEQLHAMMSQSMTNGHQDAFAETFCNTALVFLGKLAQIYKKHEVLLTTKQNELALAMGNGNSVDVMIAFRNVARPYADDIANRNPQFMIEHATKLRLFDGMDFASIWSQTPAPTQNAIWAYVGKLLTICMQAEYTDSVTQAPEFKNLFQITAEEEKKWEEECGRTPCSMGDIQAIAARVQERMAAASDR